VLVKHEGNLRCAAFTKLSTVSFIAAIISITAGFGWSMVCSFNAWILSSPMFKNARRLARASSVFVLLTLATSMHATTQSGTVERVIDGDTIVFKGIGSKTQRVRLADIDTPELDQPWGEEAKVALKGWAENRRAEMRIVDTDRYGRLVATVWIDGQNINRRLVAEGHAWVYRRYLRDKALLSLEASAKAGGLGLWARKDVVEPRVWRQQRRSQANKGTAVHTPLFGGDLVTSR
jgi:endonuclease YncB( thermonuclease family)